MVPTDLQPSMWTPCPQVLDENVTIVGLELEDLGLVAFTLVMASLFVSGILALGVAGATWWALWRLKKGKPAGDLLHRMHEAELLRLPGIQSPRSRLYGCW